MRAQARLFLFYVLAVATLSCVDLTYEWLSPLEGELGEAVDWSGVVGLRNGAFLLANHEMGPAAALTSNAHIPEFFPLPFVALAGPEGGGFFVAVWFVGILAYACHATWLPFSSGRPRDAIDQAADAQHYAPADPSKAALLPVG